MKLNIDLLTETLLWINEADSAHCKNTGLDGAFDFVKSQANISRGKINKVITDDVNGDGPKIETIIDALTSAKNAILEFCNLEAQPKKREGFLLAARIEDELEELEQIKSKKPQSQTDFWKERAEFWEFKHHELVKQIADSAVLRIVDSENLPEIWVECRYEDGMITRSTSVPVVKVEKNDDGSFTAIVDYWPLINRLTELQQRELGDASKFFETRPSAQAVALTRGTFLAIIRSLNDYD